MKMNMIVTKEIGQEVGSRKTIAGIKVMNVDTDLPLRRRREIGIGSGKKDAVILLKPITGNKNIHITDRRHSSNRGIHLGKD